MKNLLLLLLLLAISPTTQLSAQHFYFSRTNYDDSSKLATTIPILAKQALAGYINSDKQSYFDNMFRLALVAERYYLSTSLIDSMRLYVNDEFEKGLAFQYETYAKTKLLQQQTGNQSFHALFEKVFSEGYLRLNFTSQSIVTNYANISLAELKKVLNSTIEQNRDSDTLSMENAVRLVRAFNSYHVYSQTLTIMQQIIRKVDQKTYVVEKVMIKTKDGSSLQAFAVRKRESKGKLPTVFIFNIYADSVQNVRDAKFYAMANYASVVANTRGKGSSPQSIEPFEHDGRDAFDVIDWISKQKWSNGKVGMVGGSYLGFAQWAAAKTLHPSLKTIIPQVAVGIGIDYPMSGNVFMSYMLRWIHYVTNQKGIDHADFTNEGHWNSVYKQWYKSGKAFQALDTLEGRPSPIFQRWLQHPSFDSYWQSMAAYQTDFARINFPILTTTGYFDDDQMGALYYYKQHHQHNRNANHYLVIGPYTHFGAQGYPSQTVGGYEVDPSATSFNFHNLSVEWFNYTLRNGAPPPLLKDKVNFQIMGMNQWRHTATFKEMNDDTLTYYFDNTRINQHYKLATQPNDEYIKQEIDFKDRTDTTEYRFNVLSNSLATDLTNSISFVSPTFEKPVIISGSFVSSIKAAINKKDFDITLKVYELMPDGKYFTLFPEGGFSALQRASYARDKSKRQLLRPGEKESIPIDESFLTVKRIDQGSRIVILLGVNKNPNWQINYGTGKDVSLETIADANEALKIKWFCDSYIKIPILK